MNGAAVDSTLKFRVGHYRRAQSESGLRSSRVPPCCYTPAVRFQEGPDPPRRLFPRWDRGSHAKFGPSTLGGGAKKAGEMRSCGRHRCVSGRFGAAPTGPLHSRSYRARDSTFVQQGAPSDPGGRLLLFSSFFIPSLALTAAQPRSIARLPSLFTPHTDDLR